MSSNTLRARFARKPSTIDEVLHNSDPSAQPEFFDIELCKKLTEAEYDGFATSLLEDRDWLAGRGGHAAGRRRVVEVSAPNRITLFVDPSGSNYGRYVGIAVETPATVIDQADAIRWLVENRRPEVKRDEAIRTLRLALCSDTTALRVLDDLAEQ